jgi:hypothetical protein
VPGASYSSSGSAGSAERPVCTLRRAVLVDFPSVGEAATDTVGVERVNAATGRREIGYLRECAGSAPSFRWIETGPSVDELIAGASDRARRQVTAPVPDVNPPAEHGGIVNLGMWLAIRHPDPVSVTASAGTVWATVTATLVATTFDFGNGDIVRCDGAGTPLIDPDTIEPGPCGYTFERASQPDRPERVTVSASWAVSYQSSAGSGTLPGITRTTGFDYTVREIQTIGIDG